MEKIKIGIIGTGSISHAHLQAYAKNPHVEIYAVCDINEARVQEVAKKYEVPHVYTDMEELLALEEIQAVSICTWNSAHAPCTIAALKAGKHVLCEKPMATNTQDAVAMYEAAKQADKLLMIGFVRRYGEDCKMVKDYVDHDYLGELYYSKATYLRRKGNPGGWFGDKSRSGGGPLIDLGVHVIDLVRYLMGNPEPVSVYGATFQKLFDRKNVKDGLIYASSDHQEEEICDVEDLASAMIRFDNGAVLSVEASFSLNIKKDEGTIELFGTKGGAKLSPEIELYTELNDYMVDVNFPSNTTLSFDGLFEGEINHFVDCLRSDVACRAPATDGITMMRILDAIYESADTGHEVVLA